MRKLPTAYRAVQLSSPGPVSNFSVVTLPCRDPKPHEVLVRVHACAVAYRDVLDRQGAFKFIRRPTVLGHEFAGTVAAVGSGAATRASVGDRVVSFHWDQDEAWPSPLTSRGAVDSMFGLSADGGYAEYVYTTPGALGRAPELMTPAEACSVVSTFGTVWEGAVERAGLTAGQRVLVTGASGGVGSAAVRIAKALGCEVVGVTSSPTKATFIKGLGCNEVLAGVDFKAQKPFDMVIEAVGGPTFSSSLRALAPGGRLVLLGNVDNSKVALPLGLCILNSITIVGSDSIRARHYHDRLLPFLQSHKLKPSSLSVVGLEDAGAAHAALEAKQVCGRMVLQVDADWS